MGTTMPKREKKVAKFRQPSSLVGWMLPLLSFGCAAGELSVKVDPPTATITSFEGAKPENKTLLGKGEVKINLSDLVGKVLVMEEPTKESLFVVPMNFSSEDAVTFRMNQKSDALEKKISELETKLELEKRNAQSLSEKLALIQKERHRASLLVARLQTAINQSSLTKANAVSAELFQVDEALIPAVAYTLRGKLRLLEQKRNEARQDFTRALEVSPLENEAKQFLENMK